MSLNQTRQSTQPSETPLFDPQGKTLALAGVGLVVIVLLAQAGGVWLKVAGGVVAACFVVLFIERSDQVANVFHLGGTA